jgi:hypothetical protein
MKKISMLICLAIPLSLFSQIENFTINFNPSFLTNSKLEINKYDNGYSMLLQTKDFEDQKLILDSSIVNLETFLKEYDFKVIDYTELVKYENINKDGDTIIFYDTAFDYDGITVAGSLTTNENIKNFEFWLPDKETKNHKLIEIIFDIMNFNNNRTNQLFRIIRKLV